jgi:hypothetical protein
MEAIVPYIRINFVAALAAVAAIAASLAAPVDASAHSGATGHDIGGMAHPVSNRDAARDEKNAPKASTPTPNLHAQLAIVRDLKELTKVITEARKLGGNNNPVLPALFNKQTKLFNEYFAAGGTNATFNAQIAMVR